MQYIKTVAKRTGGDLTFTVPLSVDEQLNGLQQPIDEYITRETGLSINPVEDKDTFRYKPDSPYVFDALFYSGGTYDNSYEYAGFTAQEIALKNVVILRSFYIMQVYDSVETSNQTLLHNGYYNGFNFIFNGTDSQYLITEEDEFSDLYIPNWYIESLSGATTTLYGKISFYNAKTGKLQLFSQAYSGATDYVVPTGDTDMYFELQLDPTTLEYNIAQPIISHELTNADYIDKINNTLDSFDNQTPTYPTGNTFLNTGQYIES